MWFLQIHWPASRTRGPTVQPPLRETWAAMEALVKEGLVRSIGVSNFSAAKLTALLAHASIRPAVCQARSVCQPGNHVPHALRRSVLP